MGGIKKKQKGFRRPKQPFDKERIEEENELIKKYGLKNKKEIWKADSKISKIRRRAKSLIPESEERKQEFFAKLNKMGFKISDIADVLGLKIENWLDRRLQTFVFKKKLANNIKQARQLIVHKHVLVDGKIVNVPSFFINTDLENKISLKEGRIKAENVEKKEIKQEENKSKENQDGK